ncbi:MAG: sigma-70 family polymerase sigma factor [Paenibacillaceae bacterium]|jgi:RNA polymerase sigma-70 factor (ECF subfamily)|nr:sigma-70 family polymerase sigma factor [Paenibacillaceae bacterium]
MRNKSDEELIRLVLAKCREALEELYERYVRLVYSFAFRSTRDEHQAREIVQLVFTRLWSTEKGYDSSKGAFVNWLLTITRNLTIDLLRKERKHSSNLYLQTKHWETFADNRVGPEEIAARNWVKETIQEAYNQLSESQIQLLQMLYWEGYTLSEIAASRNEPLGTVKSRLHQTLKILRRRLPELKEG